MASVDALLLDPYARARVPVTLELTRHERREHDRGNLLVDLWPEPHALQTALRWPPPDLVGYSLFSPDRHKFTWSRADGTYVAGLITFKVTAGKGVEKAPGVTVAGRTFVGRVLLVCGRDVYDRRGNNFERLLPLTAAAREVAQRCEFLSPKEAQRRRVEAVGATGEDARAVLGAVGVNMVAAAPAGPMAREGTCFGCGKASPDARKCAGCCYARYCSKECQVAHWRVEHRDACAGLREAV